MTKTLTKPKGTKDKNPKFQGNCKLESCGKPFRASRPWARFCSPEHRDEYNNDRIARARKLLNETEKQNPPPPQPQ